MSVHANIEPLLWESDFFQRCSAQLSFLAAAPPLTLAAMQRYEVIQAKVSATQVRIAACLNALGFQLVEGEVDLSFVLRTDRVPQEEKDPKLNVCDAQLYDLPWLIQQAGAAFEISRFRPPWYQAGDSARFYATWVEKALYGTFDHQCLLAVDKAGQRQGWVTLRELSGGEARIGLLAVAPEAKGEGVGYRLLLQAQRWCQARGLRCLRVATQAGNLPALHLYIRSGAQIDSIAYWLYR